VVGVVEKWQKGDNKGGVKKWERVERIPDFSGIIRRKDNHEGALGRE